MNIFNTPNALELLGKMFVQVDKNNQVIKVNSQTCETLGYKESEIIGKNWFEKFVPKVDVQNNSLDSSISDLFYDKPILTKSGQERMISWHKTEIFGPTGTLESIVCVGDDVSRHENYLVTLHKISSILLDNSTDIPYSEFACLVGEAANADHTYVFVNYKLGTGEIIARKVSEWGRGQFIDNSVELPGLNNIDVGSFAYELTRKISAGVTINLKTSSFPKTEQEFFHSLNIKAILLIPIIIEKQFFGFVGFDNRGQEREWTNSEIKFLKASVKNLEQRINGARILRALKLENKKFQATMNAIDPMVIVSKFETGEVIYVNKAGVKSLGKVEGKLVRDALKLKDPLPDGYCVNKLLVNDDGTPAKSKDWVLENSEFGKVFSSKVKAIKWTDNEWVRLDTVTDVSEKRKAVQTLLDSESKFRKLSALTIEGILIHERGIVLDANEALSNILQYSYEEMIGKNIIELAVLPEYHDIVLDNLKKKNPDPYEVYARRKDGVIIPTEVEAKNINYDDEILRVVAIRDITERKKAEQELIRQKNRAEESNRLKTQFLNNMSHEIRTPLNGIVGFTQFLDDPGLTAERKSHFVNIIQSSSAQLVRIIDDIIEISKLETKQVKPRNEEVSLNSILLELFSIFELKAKEKNISLHLKKGLTDKQSKIITDKTKLFKVLNNLVENALKFTSIGSVEIGYLLDDNILNLWVKDSGIGIPKEKQKVIFERFSQADTETSAIYGGLGLGLSIAKENTQLLGGEISLESNLGDGATFKVQLPYNPVESELLLAKKVSEPDYKYHVLVAEDEEVNFIFLEFLLQSIDPGIKVANVRNGKDAVTYCENHSDINMIFMDVKMPEMDGFEATSKIRSNDSETPIIAITAYSSYADEKRAKEVGCDDFLTKPIDTVKFKSICEKILFQN